jgi:hypothetical protein
MSVACTPALTQDTVSHLWMLGKPIRTKVKTGLAGIRGNSVRPRKRARRILVGMFELQVQSSDPKIKAEREATCHLVLKRFRFDDPGEKLLCFIDDKDFAPLKSGDSKGNRGGFVPKLLPKHPVGFSATARVC